MSILFSPHVVGSLTFPNRIVVSPMCQYSADHGRANDWHRQHLMQLALSGAGLVMLEATAVEPRGRITHGCLGLYSDETEAALASALAAARTVAAPGTRFGIQLAHAGRKGSTEKPWRGNRPLAPEQSPWPCVSASAVAFADGWPVPEPLDESGLAATVDAFIMAARRAARIGFDVIELHAGHGYLLHQFQSPLSNKRGDGWGGDAMGRHRLIVEIADRVRAVLPDTQVLGARITGKDWASGGLAIDDAVLLATQLGEAGVGYACVTSGFVVKEANIPFGPGYQVALAEEVKRRSGLSVRAVGGIMEPHQAEDIVAQGRADQVAIGRAFLADPRWPWRAAETLGQPAYYAPQYRRAVGLRHSI